MPQVLHKTTTKQENILSKAMFPVLFYLRAKHDVIIDVCVFLEASVEYIFAIGRGIANNSDWMF